MNTAQLIAAMIDAASPVTKHYWTDIGHDARLIASAKPGDAFLWAPVEFGSRVIVLWRGDKPNIRAASINAAMREDARRNNQPLPAWHHITIGQDDCTLTPMAADDACSSAWTATRKAEAGGAHVSELHL